VINIAALQMVLGVLTAGLIAASGTPSPT